MYRFIASIVVTVITTLYLIGFFRRYASRLGLVDYPGGHRHHSEPTPLVGGLGMCMAFLIGILILPTGLNELRALAAAAVLLIVIGVLDDLHDLSSRARFAAQIAAGLLICYWGGVLLEDLGELVVGQRVVLGAWAVPITVFSVVGVVNALNMADGIDGLAGSTALLTGCLLIVNAVVQGAGDKAMVLSVLCASIMTFLYFNLSSRTSGRKVFMGDAGSMFLGLALSWFLISMSQGEERVIRPVTALWLLAIPLYDTVGVMLHRIMSGKTPFKADRQHIHHVLKRMGINENRILFVILGVALLFGVVGTVSDVLRLPEQDMFVWYLGFFVLYYLAMSFLWRRHPPD